MTRRLTADQAATIAHTDSTTAEHGHGRADVEARSPPTPARARRAGSTTSSAPPAVPKWPAPQSMPRAADRPRAAIAPATINVDASRVMSWPDAEPCGGTGRLPTIPPIALARPPPSALVVSHGSQTADRQHRAHRTRPANRGSGEPCDQTIGCATAPSRSTRDRPRLPSRRAPLSGAGGPRKT